MLELVQQRVETKNGITKAASAMYKLIIFDLNSLTAGNVKVIEEILYLVKNPHRGDRSAAGPAERSLRQPYVAIIQEPELNVSMLKGLLAKGIDECMIRPIFKLRLNSVLLKAGLLPDLHHESQDQAVHSVHRLD